MAEIFLIPVAKQILGKLGDLALEQIGFLWTLKPEILKLKDTLSTIQAVLLDAEEKQSHNHQVRHWLEKLSDVMYDADDLLDDVSTEALRQTMEEADNSKTTRSSTATCWSMVCFLFSSLPKQLAYDLKIAHDIKAIREKLDDIAKDKDNLHLEIRPEEALPLPSRETDSCPPLIVVGREDDKKNIIQLLLNANFETNISVVPIVGMGGLGKTTLAQLVFDDKQVHDYFDIKVWVYVSQSFDIKVILEKMLRSITLSQTGLELDILQDLLRKELSGKRFLFVLDDIWEESAQSWEILAKYLVVGAPGSKVLVTTWSTKVAEISGKTVKSGTSACLAVPYLLKGLSLEEAWNLLVIKALDGKIPQNSVERIGRQILEKCHGFPLAISTISGLLSSMNPETEWEQFLESEPDNINKEETGIMLTLKLSYNHLPSHMRHCFAYCKLFPKGHTFDVQMLIQLWVAEGYVESEYQGLDCFKTLRWRSFFQETEMDELGSMSKCRMHDMMHDLADSITGAKILRISNLTTIQNISSNTRHLALFGDYYYHIQEADLRDELGNANKVRTLICEQCLPREECELLLHNFRHLRVLVMLVAFSNSDASTLLHSVGQLKHLRYLRFSCERMERLSDSITNLLNLQVLNVSSSTFKEFPRDIGRMVNLKHLYLASENSKYFPLMPKGIGELKSLETIPDFCRFWEKRKFVHLSKRTTRTYGWKGFIGIRNI